MIDGREGQVTRAFADNSLAEGADVVDLLRELTTRCAVMLEVASAGALLADAKGTLHVVAASSERTRNLELFHLQREDGPCSNCFREGAAVSVPDLGEAHDRLAARRPGRERSGLRAGARPADAAQRPRSRDAQAVRDVGRRGHRRGPRALAGTGARSERRARAGPGRRGEELVTQQLQTALCSRVVLDQAKGLLAQLCQLDMDVAFAAPRRFVRAHNLRLSEWPAPWCRVS